MTIFSNPSWTNNEVLKYQRLEDIPQSIFDQINADLDRVTSKNPRVTIIIPAWNEEVNVVKCLYTLSKNVTTYPFDIIIINNNSTDRTQQTLDRLHVKSLMERKQGAGPARQTGQENALGQYILLADADCFYPVNWIQKMMNKLTRKGVVCVYGRYSFLVNEGESRLKFSFYEFAKDLVAEVRHINRPHLNCYGMSMGYIKEYGLKAGYMDRNIRGEDGRLCFDMMQYGKVAQVRSSAARVWTGARTLDRDGSLSRAFLIRMVKEIFRIPRYFSKQAPHDTKTSPNDDPEVLKYFEKKKQS